MGDFNINASHDPLHPIVLNLQELDYELIVDSPTHIRGGLIDHVYFLKTFKSTITYSVCLKSVYYSDHDAISLHFQDKSTTDQK